VKRVDGAGIEIDVIGVSARRVVVGILRRADAQPARHAHQVGYTDLRARIGRALPLRDRRGLVEGVNALPDEDAHQRGRHALSHRPALERRVHGDALAVALGDDASFPRHDERRRHGGGWLESGVERLADLCHVEARRRILWQHVAHRARAG
jgi:hypothetical protein